MITLLLCIRGNGSTVRIAPLTVGMRKRIYEIVQRAQPGDALSRAYDIFIVIVALASLVPLMFKEQDGVLTMLDVVTVYILFFDYVLR